MPLQPLRVWPDAEALAASLAEDLARRVRAFRPTAERPMFVLGVCTGSTPLPLYARLVELHAERRFDLRHCCVVALDEYVGTRQYRDFLLSHLLEAVPPAEFHCPDGLAADLEAECARYESFLRANPADVWLAGVGRNGHVAFHEPGTDLTAGTHVSQLTADTLGANARFGTAVPPRALTVGVGTLMRCASSLWVMATGETKAAAVERGLGGDVVTPLGELLAHHRDCVLHCDEDAAADLRVRTYKAALQARPRKRAKRRAKEVGRKANPEALELCPSSRVVVFAPHPDDECFASELMLTAQAAGAALTVVWCTPGTGGLAPGQPADLRYREGEQALAELLQDDGKAAAAVQTIRMRLPFYSHRDRTPSQLDVDTMLDVVRRTRPTHAVLCADADPHGTHAIVHALAQSAVRSLRPDCSLVEFCGAWPPLKQGWAPNVWLTSTQRDRKRRMWAAHASQRPLPVPGTDARPLEQRYFDGLGGGSMESLRLLL